MKNSKKIIILLGVCALTATSAVVAPKLYEKLGLDQVGVSAKAFDYTEVEMNDNLDKGVIITCKQDKENNDVATVDVNFAGEIDLSNALAITMRIKAMSGSYPFFFEIVDTDGNSLQLPSKTSGNQVKYVKANRSKAYNCTFGGNDHSVFYPNECDGTFVAPMASMEAKEGTIDLTKVKKLRFGVAVFYDYEFNCAFGDVGVIDNTSKEWTKVLDVSKANFKQTFVVSAFSDYVAIKQYHDATAAPMVGDVKLMTSLKFEDETTLHNDVKWFDGDNCCTYNIEDDMVRVHIGPYEIGHQYGSYMCLHILNNENYTDFNFYRETDAGKEYAKGLSVYLKNCSRKEIGINLQWDEINKNNPSGTSSYERWLIKGYPAMYYAWDVKTDAEYTFFAKSDQIQIPIGFEGYVRIPFDQMRVPDWNIGTEGVDQEMNLDNFNNEFFLTSDNTRYEDLEFCIKEVGCYFNETSKGDLFDNSHSIKTNMGL